MSQKEFKKVALFICASQNHCFEYIFKKKQEFEKKDKE